MIPTPGMSQQDSSVAQQAQSKYVWEGYLSGQRQGQPVFITKLEGYGSASASERLAANWPTNLIIVRLISQYHMNNKQYHGNADFLVFHARWMHGFLGQLQEKKLCAVIQLPSQTLLLSVSDKACHLIGKLLPGPQIPTQPQQQQQMQQQQATTPADATDATALAAASTATDATTAAAVTNATAPTTYAPQQQMVGAGIGQAYIQGGGQGQVSSQVPPNLPGGGGQGQVSSQVPPNLPGGGGFMG